MPTEAQRKASKKWAEANRETNIKRISECIQRRYQNDEDFRNKKRETERERQRVKREERKAQIEANPPGEEAVPQAPQAVERPQIQQPIIYGF